MKLWCNETICADVAFMFNFFQQQWIFSWVTGVNLRDWRFCDRLVTKYWLDYVNVFIRCKNTEGFCDVKETYLVSRKQKWSDVCHLHLHLTTWPRGFLVIRNFSCNLSVQFITGNIAEIRPFSWQLYAERLLHAMKLGHKCEKKNWKVVHACVCNCIIASTYIRVVNLKGSRNNIRKKYCKILSLVNCPVGAS